MGGGTTFIYFLIMFIECVPSLKCKNSVKVMIKIGVVAQLLGCQIMHYALNTIASFKTLFEHFLNPNQPN